jgi:hypothetical protein
MDKSITGILLALFLATGQALAQGNIPLKEDAPDRYVVQKGDTLWSIATKFLKEPWRWPEIWKLNQDQIKNPNRIFPGNVIVLDRSHSEPSLTLATTVKVSTQVRSEPLAEEAIPPIRPNSIEPFLIQPLVIEQDGLENAPRIVATEENRVHIGPGGLAYIAGAANSKEVNWQIFRPGKALIDPDTQRTLGYEAVFLGTGRMTRGGNPATLQVVTAKQEIGTGDRLIATGKPMINQYLPHAPKGLVQARVISIYGAVAASEGGPNSIVALNKGTKNGVEHGHVLALYRAGASAVDPASSLSRDAAPRIQLPDERYGLVLIFRTFDTVSYALVMESSRPVASGDLLRTP